jgi:hypothetical protein
VRTARPTLRARIWSIALSAAIVAVAVAACGGSGATPSHKAGAYGPANSPAAVSRCMRANGVSGFPDPREGPGGGGVGFPGGLLVSPGGSMVVMGQPFSGPVVLHAEAVCKAYLPPGGPGPVVSASQKAAAIANAQCMRTHGVPSFPDPTFSGANITANLGGVNPESPAFKHAAAECQGVGGGFRISARP